MTELQRRALTAGRMYLEMRGYTILEQNYRRPRVAIDIIAQKADAVYFIECCYYRDDDMSRDESIAYVSGRLKSYALGAISWMEEMRWQDAYRFSSLEITGKDFHIMSFVDNIQL